MQRHRRSLYELMAHFEIMLEMPNKKAGPQQIVDGVCFANLKKTFDSEKNFRSQNDAVAYGETLKRCKTARKIVKTTPKNKAET